MEALVYDVRGITRRQRVAQLHRACASFAAEPHTRRDVRAIALLVPLPSLVQPREQRRRRQQQPQQHAQHTTTLSSSSLTAAAAAAVQQATAVTALCAHALAVAQRLRRARRDARALSRHLTRNNNNNTCSHARKDKTTAHNLPITAAAAAPAVVVVAVLQPTTCDALAVYTSWQSDGDARARSPLRHAHALMLSDMQHELLLQWSSLLSSSPSPSSQRTALSLSTLLLPHQSLLLDVTWCVVPATSTTIAAATATTQHTRPRSEAEAATYVRLFVTHVLPTARLLKGRVALWLSYVQLLPCCTLTAATTSSSSSSSPFVELHHRVRELYTQLYATRGAAGQNTQWRLCCGYGGSAAALAAATAAATTAVASSLSASSDEAKATLAAAAATRDTACFLSVLLHTRALRDVYALLSLLTADDRADLYTAACVFCRGMLHRCQTAATLLYDVCSSSGSRRDNNSGNSGGALTMRRRAPVQTTATMTVATTAASRKRARSPSSSPPSPVLAPLAWEESV